MFSTKALVITGVLIASMLVTIANGCGNEWQDCTTTQCCNSGLTCCLQGGGSRGSGSGTGTGTGTGSQGKCASRGCPTSYQNW
eukprot:Pgem_evm1s16166